MDDIDRRLLLGLRDDPRGSISDLARGAGVARGTAYARLDRMERDGIVVGYGPEVEPSAAGFDVVAFCTLEIAQGTHDPTVAELVAIPEILEVHTITGEGDLLCRIVARSNDDLHGVIQQITAIPTVSRSQTQLSLHTSMQRSALHLLLDAREPAAG